MTVATSFEAWCSETMTLGNCRWMMDHRVSLLALAGSALLVFAVAEGLLRLREHRKITRGGSPR